MSVDLKTLTPDASLPTTGFIFGADSQASASPSVYTTAAVATTVGLQFPAGAQATPSISTTGDNDTGIWFPAANTVAASTAGLERIRITSAGNVGINTTNPTTQLQIEGAPANITLRDTRAASNGFFQMGARGGSGDLAILDVDPNNVIANSVFAINVDGIERMRITSGGNVGIGNTSAAYRLTVADSGDAAVSVQSTGTIQTAYVRIVARQSSADDEWNIVAAGSGLGASSLRFVKGGFTSTPSAIITSAGNVGIGTTTPNSWSRLAVQGTDATGFTGITSVNSNGNTGIAGIQFASDTTYTKAAIGLLRQAANGAGALVFYNDSASDAANWSPSTDEKMRITSAGNVGVGTTAPGERFHVFSGGAEFAIQWDSTGSKSWVLGSASGRAYIRNKTDNIEAFTVLNGGNVGIGTTSPGYPLTVAANSTSASLRLVGRSSDNIATFEFTNNAQTVTNSYIQTGDSYMAFAMGGSERMRITSAGDVGIGTGVATPQARLDVAGRIWSTPPAGGFAGMTMYTAAASGFAPGQIAFTRASATGGATPNNSAVGEFRFEGRDANGSYTSFASINAEMFTNAAGGAPASMSFLISASGASAQERMRLTSQGLGVGSTSFGTSAERVLSIGTGVAPTTGPADTIQIYSTDLSAGNTILSVYTEGAGATNAGITNTTVTNKIAVRINGTVYYLLATTNGT